MKLFKVMQRVLSLLGIFIFQIFPLSAQSMKSEIENYYQKSYNFNVYSFIGGRLFYRNYRDARILTVLKNLDQVEASPASIKKFQQKLSELHSLTQIDCLTSHLKICLIIHGADEKRTKKYVSLFINDGVKISQIDFPIFWRAGSFTLAKMDNSWIISNRNHGKVYKINSKGQLSELSELRFDPKKDILEIHQIWNGSEPAALGILVQGGADLLNDRTEKKWSFIDKNFTVHIVKAQKNCWLKGYQNKIFACLKYDNNGNSIIDYFYSQDLKTLSFLTAHNLGQVSVEGNFKNYMNGFLFNLQQEGHNKLSFLPVHKKSFLYAQRINKEFEKIRSHGDISIWAFSSLNDRILLWKGSSIKPYEFLMIEPSNELKNYTEKGRVFKRPQILQSGIFFFDRDKIKVERFLSQDRKVPYTVISQPGSQGRAKGKAILEVYASYDILLSEEYLREFGKFWVQEGGSYIYVHARGGGGFGRKWRKAGYGTDKIQAVYDLENVAEEIIKKGYAQMGQINLMAASAGGIVAGAASFRRAELFSKVVLTSPCLVLWDDARGYCTGSNEFGNPLEPKEMELMVYYSPAHLLSIAKKVIPYLIIQHSKDTVVPTFETKTFLGIRKDLNFARVIEIEGVGHGETYSLKDQIYVSTEILKFLLDEK